ncbi:MAG TPA: hypothetical protein VJQ09_00720 [Candidatus Limnocylindria bacterium]|nr:hypothetical protein [Candidatus Limnocylindria bacterium]
MAVSCAQGQTPAGSNQPAAETTPPPVRYDAKPAAADGYVFVNAALASESKSADGWRAGGVALTRDTAAPAGFAPLTGTVELADATTNTTVASVRPDGTGLAKFANVAAGRYRLRVLTPTPREFPLTLVGGATVRWGSYPVSRAQAVETAKQQAASAIRPDTTLIASPQSPLPAGVVISPALGDDAGAQPAALDTTVAKPSWFFYVDPFTDQKFHHPVKYVLVDAETGQATTKDADSWPALNKASYYRPSDDLAKSADLLLTPSKTPPKSIGPTREQPALARGAPAPKYLSPQTFDHVPGCSSATTYALLVQGADEGPQRGDMDQVKSFFGHGGIPPASVYQWKPTAGKSPRDEINAMWAKIKAAATPCDYVFVFVTAHGNRNGLEQLDTDATNKDGSPVGYESWSPKNLDWNNCRACHITIIIDACYSGRTLNDLKQLFQGRFGSKVVVMASSDANHESGSYGWYDPKGRTGGAFTNALMDAFNAQSAGGANVSLGNVFDAANTDVASTIFSKAIREQNPQYWERKLQPGETCQLQPTGTKNPPPTTPAQTQNQPPKITRFYATFSRPVTTYTVEATDPDGDTLTYTWTSNAFCGVFTGGNSTTATWSHPDKSLGGNCPDEPVHAGAITVTVSDGKGGTDSFTWTRGSDTGEVKR